MSNCIEIDNPMIYFRNEEIDRVALEKLLIEAGGNITIGPGKCPFGYANDQEATLNNVWWFLCGAVEFHDSNGVMIHFATGRSTHTERDFRSTLLILCKYLKKEVNLSFKVRNEYDGFKRVSLWRVHMHPERGLLIQ